MILLVDIGNTNIYMGIYENQNCISTYRTHTDTRKSSDDYAEIVKKFVSEKGKGRMLGAIISSVVPSLTGALKEALDSLYEVNTMVVGPNLKSGMPIKMDHPSEVGADLISVSVGGIHQYGYPLLICDLGTATKIIAIDEKGAFVGGVVMPGLKISLDALVGNTAQLPEINLSVPKKVIGKNTIDSMNSGTIYGHIDAILGLVKRMEEELGQPAKKILTGGYAKTILKNMPQDFIYDEKLILDGLFYLYQRNGGKEDEK